MDPRYQRVELNDGHFMPVLGFGTYAPPEVPRNRVVEVTKLAIEAGFRHIDSAYIYNNEEQVGLAIRSKIADGSVKREDIFYTSKLWCTFRRPELVQSALESSLKKLQLDYVDLYLIHFPVALKPGEDLLPKDENGKVIFDTVDLCATWEVECHPYLNQSKLLDFCKSKDIVLVAHSALGTQRHELWVDQSSPVLLEDSVLCAMAKKHKRSPALIALRYQLQRGVVVLAKSYNEQRIRENVRVSEFQLSSADMKVLDGLNRNFRYVALDYLAGHPNYPFSDEY
ncbi:aldo-keto reductase family 1 member C4 isoform X4 [Aotus nancymaae]|uniref:aldo-keto reductase family 1 member C4 isoform X4 n=1 Tax=Aotus nancymaae TaxID=37293 RepID=UPI0030FE26F6